MKSLSLTVNGKARHVVVEPRTQLAEVLRDHLHLTGTHLGCEQGVCGACTVLMDGRPVRSCIAYAANSEGAKIETIEGFAGDQVMDDLRRAFSRQHALQCGFCTPGMLIAARDIVMRLDAPDPARVRRELSGNLCRCTGYMGIVAAVCDVIAGTDPNLKDSPASAHSPARETGFASFEIAGEFNEAADGVQTGPRAAMTEQDGWTVIPRSFVLPYTSENVWKFFENTESVCRCIPGVQLDQVTNNQFAGKAVIKFGPISAQFTGEGARESDPTAKSGKITGKGKESKGQSNVRVELKYSLSHAADNAETAVDLELRFQLQGMLAQFNRKDLVEGFIDLMLRQFLDNCSRVLSGEGLAGARSINAFALIIQLIKLKLARIFRT